MEKHPLVKGLRWIMEHGRDSDGKPWTMSNLSDAAGLSRSYVSVILSGRQSAENVGIRAITSLADAAGVSPSWLATGVDRDAPDESAMSRPEQYPSRSVVVAMAREKRIDPAAIRALQAFEPPDGEDPGEQTWYELLFQYVGRSEWMTQRLEAMKRGTEGPRFDHLPPAPEQRRNGD